MFQLITKEAEKVLSIILDNEADMDYWFNQYDKLSKKEFVILKGCFEELKSKRLIDYVEGDFINLGLVPVHIEILKDGYLYQQHKEEQKKTERELTMSEFEKKLADLLERAKSLSKPNRMKTDSQGKEQNLQANIWMDDVQTFYSTYLRSHPLSSRIDTLLIHRRFYELVAALTSISKDEDFIDKMNGVEKVEVPKYQAKTLPEYDVFISHANKDKEELIEELYQSLQKLGISIFYDKESLEWGDNWKERILNGTKKAEFAIIVISENFFDREWTERELSEFLNRQNRNGQKLILPIIHNITTEQLKAKYPNVADIQAIDSKKYNCDQIALLFARQLIKRLKA